MFMPTGKQDGSMRSGIFPEGFCVNVGWRWRYVRRRPIDAEVLPGHVATLLCSLGKIGYSGVVRECFDCNGRDLDGICSLDARFAVPVLCLIVHHILHLDDLSFIRKAMEGKCSLRCLNDTI